MSTPLCCLPLSTYIDMLKGVEGLVKAAQCQADPHTGRCTGQISSHKDTLKVGSHSCRFLDSNNWVVGTMCLDIHSGKWEDRVSVGLNNWAYSTSDTGRLPCSLFDWARKTCLGMHQRTGTEWRPTLLWRRAEVHSTETRTRQLSTLHCRLSEVESRVSIPSSSTLSSSLIRM